jgi:mannose-1-phosphate guanylyltransferase
MNSAGTSASDRRWAVILAGGDGKRLLTLTRKIAGDDRPKQFCAVMGTETLLQQTQRRISRLIPPQRTLLSLTRNHEPFYSEQVKGIPPSRLLIQPRNRGTAPAILPSLLGVGEMDPDGVVVFFPSDHHFSDDEAFIGHIDSAYTAAASRTQGVILLGIPPESPEVEYGWIEPDLSENGLVSHSLSPVKRFWEKPDQEFASQLMERGCLWNSFVMVGRVSAFLNLIRQALPDLVRSFESIRATSSTVSEVTALSELYSGISTSSFSHDVLSVRARDLTVLHATGLAWSDLGEPGRVRSVLDRKCDLALGFEVRAYDGRTPARQIAAG